LCRAQPQQVIDQADDAAMEMFDGEAESLRKLRGRFLWMCMSAGNPAD
jgi:hypothetical protein